METNKNSLTQIITFVFTPGKYKSNNNLSIKPVNLHHRETVLLKLFLVYKVKG